MTCATKDRTGQDAEDYAPINGFVLIFSLIVGILKQRQKHSQILAMHIWTKLYTYACICLWKPGEAVPLSEYHQLLTYYTLEWEKKGEGKMEKIKKRKKKKNGNKGKQDKGELL